jgi:hypothetical protein
MAIGASVGKGGVNALADVMVVQHLLNAWLEASGQSPLDIDGGCGDRTIAAIAAYQARVLGSARPDGLIDPGGRTWTALATGQGIAPRLSGAAWWRANQARYPNSAEVSDLAPPFRDQAAAFVQALRDAGADVTVSATRRNPIRAQLMHYCWRVARDELTPSRVPAIPGCAIHWDHGDSTLSRKGAQEMVGLFQIAFQPSLTSNHIQGRAIDMTIRWNGTLRIRDRKGRTRALDAPRSGDANRDLHAVGASYGVRKLLSDPPHWSDDGH